MKKLLTLTCIYILSLTLNAQEKTLNEINSLQMQHVGAMLDKNNDVDGYYLYYEVDKLKKKQREYAIKILDNNLNNLATKSYIDSKNTALVDSKFNNQALMFVMTNLKEKQYKLVTFDREGNQGEDIVISLNNKELKYLSYALNAGALNLLSPVDDKGFLFNT